MKVGAIRFEWEDWEAIPSSTPNRDFAWVQAYLYRVEGDLGNAGYWYRRSGKPESKLSLTEQRQQIAEALLLSV